MSTKDKTKAYTWIALGILASFLTIKEVHSNFSQFGHFIRYWNWETIPMCALSACLLFAMGYKAFK